MSPQQMQFICWQCVSRRSTTNAACIHIGQQSSRNGLETYRYQFTKRKVLGHVGDRWLPDQECEIENRGAPRKLVTVHAEDRGEAVLQVVSDTLDSAWIRRHAFIKLTLFA